MNIYGKLTVLCLTLVLFTAGVLSYFADRQVDRKLRKDITTNITQQSEAISEDISLYLASRMSELRVAAQNDYFQSANFSKNELNRNLRQLEEINPLYYSFSYFANDRTRLGDSKGLDIDQKHPKSIYWNSLEAGDEEAVDISASISLGENVVHFAKKINLEGTDQYAGVLVSRILLDDFYKIFEGYTSGDTDERKINVTIIDNTGLILYSNEDPSTILEATYRNFDLVQSSSGTKLLETEDELFFVTTDTQLLSLVQGEWKLILSMEKKLAFGPLLEVRKQILYAVVPVIIISVILSLIAANYFVKPIVQLSAAAEEFSKGNLNVEIPVNSKDEIGRLAKRLSHTSESLIRQLKEQKALNKKLKEQNDQIEIQKNQLIAVSSQMSDSIGYAERIQRASLPPLSTLTKVFPDSFVTYKPKDIIGGDFYWFESIRRGNNEYMIIACGDCTGHGVPGAIMSIMGSNQLTNIIYYQNYLDPKKIIARLDKVIKFELQSDSDQTNRDGMELGICVIDLDTLKMDFAGVGIPLRLVKYGGEELSIFKTPRTMVGGIEGDEQEAFA
ncbi:MAG: HAMP domain-containing protein, partial [Bacteroidota bacterium]